MRILIADGGTGGHIFPAIAVADEMRRRKGVDSILFTGTKLGLEGEIVPRHDYELRLIRVGGLIGKSWMTRIRTLLQLPLAYRQGLKIVGDFRPDVAIGFGAYASGPVLVAAHRRKVPVLLVEPNAIPGFTNRMALRLAARVAVPFEDRRGVFRGKAVVTGTPVRPMRSAPEPSDRFTLGILGGSQGSHGINRTVVDALPGLTERADRIHVIHQTGKVDFDWVKERYRVEAPSFEVLPFIHEVERFYNRCHLLLCRSGAITLAELTSLGKPALLVPLPTATHNHQEENARRLQEAGAARMILQKDFTPPVLLQQLDFFQDSPAELSRMADASRDLGRPDATKAVCDLALSLAKS
jgi:UDP-N-acetylglucosamine--N-acetylmuramyl-(pentapeptide) pyrophosphoryl-undecaprenol N-acetylglucosamine transferase